MEHRRGSHVRRLRDQTRYLESVEALGSYGRTSPSYKPAQSYAELSAGGTAPGTHLPDLWSATSSAARGPMYHQGAFWQGPGIDQIFNLRSAPIAATSDQRRPASRA